MQTALTIFYLAWLIAVLVFLALIYRSTTSYIRRMEDTVFARNAISAEAALKSAEAAAKLAEMVEQERHA